MLDSKARQDLRARAHHLKPVITVGAQGVTTPLLAELDRALFDHELLKVRLPALDKEERDSCVQALAQGCAAEVVGRVGRILMLYRQRPSNAIFVPMISKP
ncbi:ribosome assembly RNA-binding protein YhbY [Candidatus Igneacidithiobacillus taiwanensis]|uniref:ribosome assembly RNA-binding protein YhbY n=1 Tax=Candidatus Igneacidithiobacillus taiwanensis TaxID=1945924 RepID=UPI0028A093F0|nr:ribosome assembly RNA-binding protein YhbY [Candidatus Igneacidithiobacillus taiwanensis]